VPRSLKSRSLSRENNVEKGHSSAIFEKKGHSGGKRGILHMLSGSVEKLQTKVGGERTSMEGVSVKEKRVLEASSRIEEKTRLS